MDQYRSPLDQDRSPLYQDRNPLGQDRSQLPPFRKLRGDKLCPPQIKSPVIIVRLKLSFARNPVRFCVTFCAGSPPFLGPRIYFCAGPSVLLLHRVDGLQGQGKRTLTCLLAASVPPRPAPSGGQGKESWPYKRKGVLCVGGSSPARLTGRAGKESLPPPPPPPRSGPASASAPRLRLRPRLRDGVVGEHALQG